MTPLWLMVRCWWEEEWASTPSHRLHQRGLSRTSEIQFRLAMRLTSQQRPRGPGDTLPMQQLPAARQEESSNIGGADGMEPAPRQACRRFSSSSRGSSPARARSTSSRSQWLSSSRARGSRPMGGAPQTPGLMGAAMYSGSVQPEKTPDPYDPAAQGKASSGATDGRPAAPRDPTTSAAEASAVAGSLVAGGPAPASAAAPSPAETQQPPATTPFCYSPAKRMKLRQPQQPLVKRS